MEFYGVENAKCNHTYRQKISHDCTQRDDSSGLGYNVMNFPIEVKLGGEDVFQAHFVKYPTVASFLGPEVGYNCARLDSCCHGRVLFKVLYVLLRLQNS